MADSNYKIKIGYDVDTSGLKNIEALKKILTQISNMKGISDKNVDADQIKKASDAAELLLKALKNSENVNLGKINLTSFDATLKKAGTSLNALTSQLSGSLGRTGVEATQRLNQELALTGKYAIKSNKFLDDMYSTLVKTAKWNISSGIINNIQGSFQRAFGYIEDLDESLTNIRIVTGASADEMGRFAVQANTAAKALGQSTLAYTDAALIYYQQGKGASDVERLTEVTLKAASVSQSTAEDMSNYLTAVWNGYQISSEKAEESVDKLSAVAATTGADLSELAIGMSKVASAADTMGVGMDQMNAILATITTVTREAPETVGTSLKTVLSRMTNLSLGEEDEDGIDFGKVEDTLKTMGLTMVDQTGKLKDMGGVIEEIGGKWTTFSREQQIALAQVMAGTRQYSRLISLFDNWGMYEEALETSQNSIGTLEDQNKIYLESFEAHAQELTASLEGLWNSLIQSDDLKAGLDVLTNVVNGVDGLVDGLGGVGPVLTIVGGLMMKSFGGKIAKSILDTKNNVLGLINASKEAKNMQGILNNIATGDSDTLYAKQNKALIDYANNAKNNYQVMTAEQKTETQARMNNIASLQSEIEALKEKRRVQQGNLDAAEAYIASGTLEFDDTDIQDFIRYANIVEDGYDDMGESARAFVRSLDPQDIVVSLKEAEQASQASVTRLENIYNNASLGRPIAIDPNMDSELRRVVETLNSAERGTSNWATAYQELIGQMRVAESELTDVRTLLQTADTIAGNIDFDEATAEVMAFDREIQRAYDDISRISNEGNLELGDLDSINKLTQATEALGSGLATGTAAANLLNQAMSGTASGSDLLISGLTTAGTALGTISMMASMANVSMGAFLTTATGGLYLLVAALPVVIAVFDKLVESEKEAKENSEKLRASFKEATSEVESLNGQLQTTQDKITDLLSREHLSFVEEDELKKLQMQNDELERSIRLAEIKAQKEGEKASKASKKVLNKKDEESIESFETTVYSNAETRGNGEMTVKTPNQVDVMTAAEERLRKVNELKDAYAEMLKMSAEEQDANKEAMQKNRDDLKAYEKQLVDLMDEINTEYDGLLPGMDDKDISRINDIQDAYIAFETGISESATEIHEAFMQLYDSTLYAGIKAELEGLVASGDQTDEELQKLIETDSRFKFLLATGLSSAQVLKELQALMESSGNLGKHIELTRLKFLSYKEILDAVVPHAQAVAVAQYELEKSGMLSYESAADLLEIYPELEEQMIWNGKGYDITRLALDNLRLTELASYKLNLENAKKAAREVYEAETTKQTAYKNTALSLKGSIAAEIASLKTQLKNLPDMDSLIPGFPSFGASLPNPLSGAITGKIDALQEALDQITEAEGDLKDAEEAYDVGLLTGTQSVTDSTKKSDKTVQKFAQTIDWAANSIKNLTAEITKLQGILDNTTSLTTQISTYEELIRKQTDLQDLYGQSAKMYETAYTNALKKIPANVRSKYKTAIESGSKFKIQDFEGVADGKNQKLYESIIAAQEFYDSWKNGAQSARDAGYAISEFATALAEVRWDYADKKVESLNDDIDLLNAKLDNRSSWETQNKYLDQILSKQRQIVKNYAIAVRDLTVDSKDQYKAIGSTKNLKDTSGGKVAYGDYISTKGVTDKDKLAAIKVYNASIKQLKLNVKELGIEEENLKTIISDTAQQKLENINDYYAKRTSYLSDQQGLLDNQTELAEAKGYATSKKYIEKKIELEKKALDYNKTNLTKMQAELDKAVKTGKIVEYSAAWYEMAGQIYDARDAIDQGTIALAEFDNEMANIDFENFQGLIDKFGTLTSEANFLIGLMDDKKLVDDKGNYTDEGLATQGLHAQNYDTYMYEAEEYKRKLSEIDKELAKEANKNNIELLARRQEYVNGVQSSIEAAQSEKDALIQLAQEGIKADIEATKEQYEKKKDALDIMKETQEYQDSINEKTKNIATIQKRINALEGNNSESNRRKLQELKAELADAQKDLDDTTSDKNIELQKEGYDKDIEDITKTMTEYSEDTERLFNDTIASINSSSTEVSKTLEETAKGVGYTISNEITTAWENSTTAVNAYSSNFTTAATSVSTMLGTLKTNYEELTAAADAYAKTSLEGVGAGNATVTAAESKVPTVKSILGTSSLANVLGNTGESKLNDYVASLGYGTLSTAEMYQLAQAYGISAITSKDDFTGSGASANMDLVITALKAQLNDSGTKKSLIGQILKKGKNTGGSVLNKELGKEGYATVSNTQMLQLARILGLDSIDTLEEVKYGTDQAEANSRAIWNKLKAMMGFSSGGIATGLNEAITRNGDEGITTIKTGETVLTDAFTKLMPLSVDLMKQLNNSNVQRSLSALASYSLPDFSSITAKAPNITVDVNSPLINVENMDEDMLYKLQNDKTIQKTIQDMTIGQMTTGAYKAGARW